MSMADRDGFIWFDGKLVPWREATTHVLTHTLHPSPRDGDAAVMQFDEGSLVQW